MFAGLAHYADKTESYNLLCHDNVLRVCHGSLVVEEPDLNAVTLFLLKELLNLG